MTTEPTGADLHLHTCFSDGTFTPEELVRAARGAGLRAIAVTDHDCVDGVEPTRDAARGLPLEVISGAELSTESGTGEIHIVGLFLQLGGSRLEEEMRRYQERRRQRVYAICDRLREQGVELDPDDVFRLAPGKSPGRVHVAQALLGAGAVCTREEAFVRFLGNGAPACVLKERPAAETAIEIIHQAGGAAVLAHPGISRQDEVIPELAAAGLDGLEAYSSAHSPEVTAHYLALAERHGLAVSAGSDCHGHHAENIRIGCVRLADEELDALRRRAGRGRS